MAAIVEKFKGAHFLMSEATFHRSRENVVLAQAAGLVQAGTVLGKLTTGGKYVPSPATGADGSQTGVAILLETTDATAGDKAVAIIARDAEVNINQLFYAASVNDAGKIATKVAELLASSRIIARA